MAPSNIPPFQNSGCTPKQPKHTNEREYQRVYKACIPCRKRKAKCDLGHAEQGLPEGPPCARCRREHRDCIFTSERSGNPNKRQKQDSEGATSSPSMGHGPMYSNLATEVQRSTGSDSSLLHSTRSALENGSGTTKASTQPFVKTSLDDSVMRTMVSRGNDALTILFEAAAHQERNSGNNEASTLPTDSSHTGSSQTSTIHTHAVKLSSAASGALDLWSACRFVRQGWMSAQEAITFIDLFFKHMCPLSPVINDFYAHHKNHRQLLSDDPLLCCTILAISSRYHVLPGIGGSLRSTLVHDRMWHYCQDLIMHTIFGQEKGTRPRTRSVGTVEALLLISEWHPRSLHFPPANYGWDSELLLDPAYLQKGGSGQHTDSKASPADQWLEDVIEPARRSDRMSWMLLGNAVTLAHELGIFEEEIDQGKANEVTMRRTRIRKLLYVYVNHLASRLGYVSLIPSSLDRVIAQQANPKDAASSQWQSHMTSWIALTKFSKTIADTFFFSATHTRQILHNGAYIGMLQQYLPRLDHWRRIHLESQTYQGYYQETLFVEYQYVRIYINSLGMQAACERAVANSDLTPDQGSLAQTPINDMEYGFIQEVIDASCEILRKVINLAETDTLRFAPVRMFLRITTSSIFLLKALSLGVRNTKLQSALDILDQSIQALKTSNLDEVHLAARYATLLDTHVQKLRRSFIANAQRQVAPFNDDLAPPPAPPMNGVEDVGLQALNDLASDDWLSLPFDPSLAPFAPMGSDDFEGMDFMWNLPLE